MHKLKAYTKLLRLHQPAGYILLFVPCLLGLGIGISTSEQLWSLPLFAAGSIVMRSGGCIINDIFDREIDARVSRTKNRPLPSGSCSTNEAVIILTILMLCGFAILICLPKISIILGLYTVPLIVIYPLMKRITYFPQLILGMTFGAAGVLIAYSSVTLKIDSSVMILYLGCISWTLGYDAIYAFMDAEDDEKIGIKSIALFLKNRNYKLWIFSFYALFMATVIRSSIAYNLGLYPLIGAAIASLILIWQVSCQRWRFVLAGSLI